MRRSTILPLLFAAFLFHTPGSASSVQESAALDAANAWMKLVDAGKYKESYRESAHFFQEKVTSAQWEQAAQGVRQPLGKVLSRKLKAARPSTSLPGAPDGQYLVIQFDSSFEKKKEAVETVTPMLDHDNRWRVSGYFIK